MALASDVTLEIRASSLRFLPGAIEYSQVGAHSGGLKNNRAFVESCVRVTAKLPDELEALFYDPQTSGGLLISMSEDEAKKFLDERPEAYAILRNEPIQLLTVHGSRTVMQAAVEGRGESKAKLLAVTVLTSFDQEDLADLGYATPVSDLVELRVKKAVQSGMDGIVCSPLEVKRVREVGGAGLTLVTPGVRSAGAAAGDQKRVATPAEAIANGADYLVIGRQVTRAVDPRRACEEILAEIG
jgi:orotidine-5'-phosphate decarboxylase